MIVDAGAADLAAQVWVSAEAAGLRRRAPGDTAPVLGAGNDDLRSGRAYLTAMGRWAVAAWPEAHGGLGLEGEDVAVVQRALGELAVPDLYPFAVGLALVGPTLLVHGSADQQDRWLAPIARGEAIWCQLFSEPDAGSDLAGL
ncbi:MAG TPA: acyl-CoA dehydrogenase family protein, partial [Acidimicrobiales bacterium]|nr:acyl-CoA dehydrogenase family protein [Acidimicrobiales bacterium]